MIAAPSPPAEMQSLSRAIRGVCRRPNGVYCAPPLRLPPALARRDAPLMAAATALPNRHLDLHSWLVYGPWSIQRGIGVRGEKRQSKPQLLVRFAFVATKGVDTRIRKNTATKCINKEEMWKIATSEVIDNNCTAIDNIWFPIIIANSSHRDGSIYKNRLYWESYDVDITDRNESRLEPMMLSEGTKRCLPDPENCVSHFTCNMMQIFSLTLVKSPINKAAVQLYGYIAVRDDRDYMLNYVFKFSRDDPITVQQGSLIKMTGPKRGIAIVCPVLMEFDVRVKNGGEEDDDLQLIDGAIVCSNHPSWKPLKHRICGDSGAVDLSLAVIEDAVEATIEIVISEVQTGFSLSLSSFVGVIEEYEEIQLFQGTIGESCALRRYVVAVPVDTSMVIQFKVGDSNDEHHCYFMAERHGCASQQMKFGLAYASVKVTWSTIE